MTEARWPYSMPVGEFIRTLEHALTCTQGSHCTVGPHEWDEDVDEMVIRVHDLTTQLANRRVSA